MESRSALQSMPPMRLSPKAQSSALRALIALGLLLAIISTLASDSSTHAAAVGQPMRYQPLAWTKDGYDYAPSILWDDSTSQWVMYHCGLYTPTASDAIFRSTSPDGITWTLDLGMGDAYVFKRENKVPGVPAAWDSLHVCDPTVIKGVSIAPGYSWAMWYTGIKEGGKNKIGLALSTDGQNWVRWVNNPVIDCGDPGAHFYGCGQQSVVKVGDVYRMSHTYNIDIPQPNRLIRALTSSDGLNWTLSETFEMPGAALGPDFMYAGTQWYSVIGGNDACGRGATEVASDLEVYTSSTMGGPKTLVGCLNYADTQDPSRRRIAEQGFYRDALGQQLQGSPDVWLAFGFGNPPPEPALLHDGTEEIEVAKLAIMDAEQNSVDPLLGGQACSGAGPSITPASYAWVSNGPKGDDINYWDIFSNADGINQYCDIRLANFPNPDFSTGSILLIWWFGWTEPGLTGPAFRVYFKNAGVYTPPTFYTGLENTKGFDYFYLPAQRSQAEEILFRVWESDFSNLWEYKQERIHIFSVRVIY